MPKVPATKTPSLDGYLKSELSRATKAADKELATVQTCVLDALSPLPAIVEADTKGENITNTQGVNAVKAAIELIGNANARISHLRRTKIISQMNKSLLPLTEDDGNFTDAPPTLFGPEFARKSKELVDQMKVMRSSYGFKDKQFFLKWPPNNRGVLQCQIRKGQSPKLPKQPTSNTESEAPVEQMNTTHKQSKFSHNRFQKYVVKSFCMSGYPSPLYGDSCASRETSSLLVQLAENNPGPVGPEYNSGLHDRLCVTATLTISTPASTILCGADTADLHGDHRTSTEKCNRGSDTPPTTRLLFKSLPCPQERWRTTPGNQPESVEQVCAKRTFEDGGYIHTVKDLLRQGDWLAKVDLKDAFFQSR